MTNENLLYNVINWAEVDPYKMTLNIRGKSQRSCVIVFALWFMHEPATSEGPGRSLRRCWEGALRSLVGVQETRAENSSFRRWQPVKRHHSRTHPKSLMWSCSRRVLALEELYLLLKHAGVFQARSFCSAAEDRLNFTCPQQILLVRANSDLHDALGAGPTWVEEARVTRPFNATAAFTIAILVWLQGSIKRPEAFALQQTHMRITCCVSYWKAVVLHKDCPLPRALQPPQLTSPTLPLLPTVPQHSPCSSISLPAPPCPAQLHQPRAVALLAPPKSQPST